MSLDSIVALCGQEGVLYTEIAEREAQECSTAQFIRGISGNETTYQAWRDLPLRDLPKSAKGPGSAQIVGGQVRFSRAQDLCVANST